MIRVFITAHREGVYSYRAELVGLSFGGRSATPLLDACKTIVRKNLAEHNEAVWLIGNDGQILLRTTVAYGA